MKYHLAILTPGWIDLILDGSKTIESRFTKVRCAPFRKVHADDSVYLKESGGLVKGMFRVAQVETFENLTASQRHDIFDKYCFKIFAGAQWINTVPERWWESKHATLIHVSDPIKFDDPFPFPKRDPRAWVVLDTPLHDGNRQLTETNSCTETLNLPVRPAMQGSGRLKENSAK